MSGPPLKANGPSFVLQGYQVRESLLVMGLFRSGDHVKRQIIKKLVGDVSVGANRQYEVDSAIFPFVE